MRATYKHDHPLCKKGKGHPQVQCSTRLPLPYHHSTPPTENPSLAESAFLRLHHSTSTLSNPRPPRSLLVASAPPTGTPLSTPSGHPPTHLTRSRPGNHTASGLPPTAPRTASSSSGHIQPMRPMRWIDCSLPTYCAMSVTCMRGKQAWMCCRLC
jgi:hypothetical protein